MSSQDPELERLVADMSVTQTPVTRRDGGGLRRQNQRDQGTLDGSTVTGAAFTVWSGGGPRGIPREVDMGDEQATEGDMGEANGKRFKIFVVPTWSSGFSTYCFQFIGQGASFCTARNCRTSHHHASVKTVMPGEIYVAKSSTRAFVTPTIMDAVIEDEVLTTWQALSLPLTEWNEKFLIATEALEDIPVSTAAMEIHEEYHRTKALKYKTPGKRKRDSEEEDSVGGSLLDVSVYSPYFKVPEDAPIADLDKVTGVLARLDDGIFSNNEAIVNLIAEYRQEHGKAGGAIRSLHLRLEALASTVGSVPTHLSFDYLAPSAWATIGAMAEKLDEIDKSLKVQSSRLDYYKKEINLSVEVQMQSSSDDSYAKLDAFKTAFISATRGLGGRLDNVELSMIGLTNSTPQPSPASGLPNPRTGLAQATGLPASQTQGQPINVDGDETNQELKARVEMRIDSLEKKLNGLVSKSDERAIMFSGLGFLSMGDSNAWLEMEQRRHQSGLVVDDHMAFEHLVRCQNPEVFFQTKGSLRFENGCFLLRLDHFSR
jgi:hypothetical protein